MEVLCPGDTYKISDSELYNLLTGRREWGGRPIVRGSLLSPNVVPLDVLCPSVTLVVFPFGVSVLSPVFSSDLLKLQKLQVSLLFGVASS